MSRLEDASAPGGEMLAQQAASDSPFEPVHTAAENSGTLQARIRMLSSSATTLAPKPRVWENDLSRKSKPRRFAESAAPASAQVVFSRETPVAEFLESLLSRTRTSIDAALHQLNNPRLVCSLLDASGRGVRVRLLLDRTKFEETVSTLQKFSNGRFAVRLLNGRLGPASRMHHKFALLDQRTAVTGSYNWTVGSDEQNFENLVTLRGLKEVEAFRREFAALWRRGTAAPCSALAVEDPPGSGSEETSSSPASSASTTAEEEKGFRIYLMRHGHAETRGRTSSGSKLAGPLTAEGRKRISEIAAGLFETGCVVNRIVTSPWGPALETAKLVAARLEPPVPVENCEALVPGGSMESVIQFIQRRPELRRVLVVGHEPGLSRLAARLLDSSGDANLKLKKGGCCLLAFDDLPSPSNGRLVWWLPPRLLRKLR